VNRVLVVGALVALAALAACGDDDDGGAHPPDGGAPDAGMNNPPPEITRAQAGGEPGAIVRVGELAYVTVGPRLTIWDLSDPAAPVMRGESEAFDAVLTGVAILGPNAYVSDRADLDGHVHVVDVSKPAMPMTVAQLRVAADGDFSAPLGIGADATHVFVADQEHGIAVLDVSDPAAPTVTQVIDLPGVSDIRVVGDRMYAVSASFVGGFGIDVFDLASPGFARLGGGDVGTSIAFGIGANHVVAGSGPDGVLVQDFTDPTSPKLLLQAPSARILTHDIAVSADKVWLPAAEGLYSIDLTAAPPLTVAAPVAPGVAGTNALALEGDLLTAITAKSRLVTVDLAEVPTLRADVNVTLAADAIGVAAIGDQLYIAGSEAGLRTGRLHDLQPLGRGYQDDVMLDFEDVAADGHFVYAADWFFGLRVYDVADASAPAKVGELETGGLPSAIAFAAGKVYLGEATNTTVLRVIDVADPAHPAQVGALASGQIYDLALAGTKLYSAEGGAAGGGLRIYDVADATAPKLLGSYEGDGACTEVHGVAVSGTLAVIGCGHEAHLVDVTDPAAPKKLGVWTLTQEASSIGAVALDGTRAILGHDVGITVIDVAAPAAPTLVVDKPTAYSVRGLAVPFAGRVVAAAGLGGVFQWKLP
jgi:hypothetical protein